MEERADQGNDISILETLHMLPEELSLEKLININDESGCNQRVKIS